MNGSLNYVHLWADRPPLFLYRAPVTPVCYHGAMPKRPRRPRDPNQLAHTVFLEAIGEAPTCEPEREKNPAAVALGRLGGAKGGVARAEKMTPEARAASARLAAMARWKEKPRKGGQ